MLLKRSLGFLMVCTMLMSTNVFANTSSTLSAENSENDPITIEVVLGDKDNIELENIKFSDGTTALDYDYEIIQGKTLKSYALASYFDSAAWIDRGGVISLSLAPKDNVRGDRSVKNTAWSYVASPTHGFSSDYRWKNTQVMKWQYDCHFDFARYKESWNLEPDRTADSYIFGVVLNSCNP